MCSAYVERVHVAPPCGSSFRLSFSFEGAQLLRSRLCEFLPGATTLLSQELSFLFHFHITRVRLPPGDWVLFPIGSNQKLQKLVASNQALGQVGKAKRVCVLFVLYFWIQVRCLHWALRGLSIGQDLAQGFLTVTLGPSSNHRVSGEPRA